MSAVTWLPSARCTPRTGCGSQPRPDPRQLEGPILDPLKEAAIEKRGQRNRERLAVLSANERDMPRMVSVLDEPLEDVDFVRHTAPLEAIAYFHILAGPELHATS